MTAVLDRTESHREAARRYAEKKRKSEQGIEIPLPEDFGRREESLADWRTFLPSYLPHVFFQGFTPDREEMAEAIIFAARHGGDQAVAGPRGEGKTRLAIFLTLWLMLRRELQFPVIITKNGKESSRALGALKRTLEKFNAAPLLHLDFPEVCRPIADLGGWASRAKKQHFRGHDTDIAWEKEFLALPTVPDEILRAADPEWERAESAAAGQMLGCVGIEGGIRGWNVRNRRPDLAIIDDVDDHESAKSELQTDDRESIIDSDIAGLAGPGESLARVMLCTLINRRCVAWTFTDPKQKPTWKGKRLRAMLVEPDRKDLWEEYVAKRQEAMESGKDPLGRAADDYYLANREAMDAGCVMSNPANYSAKPAEDGRPLEYSAIQAFYNKVAKIGWKSVLTEYQQDPPAEGEPEIDGLSEMLIRRRLTGIERRYVPDGAKLVAFIDLGKRRIHYVVTGWEPGAIGSVVDYGEKRTGQPEVFGVEAAIRTALDELADEWEADPYTRTDGEVVPLSVVLIDAGNWNTVVYEFCRERGGPFIPSMGDSKFHAPNPSTASKDKKPGGLFWYRSRQVYKGGPIWVVNMNADDAKSWMQDRLLTPPFPLDDAGIPIPGPRQRGSLALFGEDWKVHGEFADHILAERKVKEFKEGKKGEEVHWKKVSPDNHYLDGLYGCCVASEMVGIRLLGDVPPPPKQDASSVRMNLTTPDGRPFFLGAR